MAAARSRQPPRPRACALCRPARRERKSRDPGSGQPSARGRGADVRHFVREGARARRGRASGERQGRWRGGGAAAAPRPVPPAMGSARGGGGGDSRRRPGRRAGPRAQGAPRAGGGRGPAAGLARASFVAAARAPRRPRPAGARGRGPGLTPLPWEAPDPTRAAQIAGPACGSAGRRRVRRILSPAAASVALGREPRRGIAGAAGSPGGARGPITPAPGGALARGARQPFVGPGSAGRSVTLLAPGGAPGLGLPDAHGDGQGGGPSLTHRSCCSAVPAPGRSPAHGRAGQTPGAPLPRRGRPVGLTWPCCLRLA